MNDTALILVDYLKDFTTPEGRVYYPEAEAVIDKTAELLAVARRSGCLVVFIRHSYRKDKPDANLSSMRPCCIEGTAGDEIDPRLPIDEKKDYVLVKRRYSAFFGTDLDLVLRERGVKNLIVAGLKTNNCVNATVLDAHYRAYNTTVVADCTATNDKEAHRIYLRDMERYLCEVASLAEVKQKLGEG